MEVSPACFHQVTSFSESTEDKSTSADIRWVDPNILENLRSLETLPVTPDRLREPVPSSWWEQPTGYYSLPHSPVSDILKLQLLLILINPHGCHDLGLWALHCGSATIRMTSPPKLSFIVPVWRTGSPDRLCDRPSLLIQVTGRIKGSVHGTLLVHFLCPVTVC